MRLQLAAPECGIVCGPLPAWPLSAFSSCTLLTHCISGPLPATCSGWLEFLEEVRQQVGQLVLLTCPTERFHTPDKQAGRAVVARRNEIVRQLVADSWSGSASSSSGGSDGDRGGGGDSGGKGSSRPADNATGSSSGGSGGPRPLLLLDLDALTKERLPPDVTISQQDYHYQCYPSTTSGFASEWAPVVGRQAGIAPCLLPACHRSVHAVGAAWGVWADAPVRGCRSIPSSNAPFCTACPRHALQTARWSGQAVTAARGPTTRPAALSSCKCLRRAHVPTLSTTLPCSCFWARCVMQHEPRRESLTWVANGGGSGRNWTRMRLVRS